LFRAIGSANCIEWPSFRQSGETGTPYFFFRKRKSRQKETYLPLTSFAVSSKIKAAGEAKRPALRPTGRSAMKVQVLAPAFGYFSFPKEK